MPRYRYECPFCEDIVERTHKIEVRDTPEFCEHCYARLLRLPTAAEFSVKGFNAKNGYSK